MKKTLLFVIVSLLLSCKHYDKQNQINNNDDSRNSQKQGLILPEDTASWNVCCLYLPNLGLNLYKSARGIKIGKLELITSKEVSEFYAAVISYENKTTEKYELSNFEMVGYEVFALKFIDIKDQYYQIKNNLWIDKLELDKFGLTPISWFEYAITKEDVLGWYGNEPGLPLRNEPSSESNQIEILKGDLLQITLTNEIKGNWMKVNVLEYEVHPCNDSNSQPIKEYSGWIELLSEDGTLNIWNYEKGC